MLGCMQKVNFVIHFSLKILQRNSKLSILGNLGMSGHIHQKRQYHFEETFDNYQQGKINSILYVFLEILQRYYKVVVLGAFGMPGHAHPKWYYQFVEKCVYLQIKNQFHSPCLFEYFGHVWLYLTKMIVSTFRRLWCLLACQKKSSSITSSLRYHILKNLAILLADNIWGHSWRPRVLPDMGLVLKYQ